jgi:GAF domain-containing protein
LGQADRDLSARVRDLADKTSDLFASGDTAEAIAAFATAAMASIPKAECVDVVLAAGRRWDKRYFATSSTAAEIYSMQERHGEGPTLDAVRHQKLVRTDDLSYDGRWPNLRGAARSVGARGIVGFPLTTQRGVTGALTVYTPNPHGLNDDDLTVGTLLARLAGPAISNAIQTGQLHQALATRDVIGQAKGMVMELFGVDAIRAFELLSKLSQDTNTPLAVIATQMTERATATNAVDSAVRVDSSSRGPT